MQFVTHSCDNKVKGEGNLLALKEDTMMCSKSVTCNEYMCVVINTVKQPGKYWAAALR